jgi:hypothetical protein
MNRTAIPKVRRMFSPDDWHYWCLTGFRGQGQRSLADLKRDGPLSFSIAIG